MIFPNKFTNGCVRIIAIAPPKLVTIIDTNIIKNNASTPGSTPYVYTTITMRDDRNIVITLVTDLGTNIL